MMKKIPVGILGATGMVGQKFVELLANHPQFEIQALAASSKSEGKPYRDAMRWMMTTPLPERIAKMEVVGCDGKLPCQILFSGLDSGVAGVIEQHFAKNGHLIISNSKNHRMHPDVPLVIPEINGEHLSLIDRQNFGGSIITNPNCSVIGIAMALKPLLDRFGIEKVHATTLQAVSGAGYPGIASFDILDNVIPFIEGEEEKIEKEPLKILGDIDRPYPMQISAQCNRVAVMDGHLACLSVQLKSKASPQEIIESWNTFPSISTYSAPVQPLIYLSDQKHPQPKLHRHLGQGMSVSLGRLRPCSIFDWKFVILSHNTIRGAAGCAVLNAELLLQKGIYEKKYWKK